MTNERGGPQDIPRPPHSAPGPPAPWLRRQWTGTIDADRAREVVRPLGTGRPADPLPGGASLRGTAAVAVLLSPTSSSLEVLLTRRAWHLRTHRGEVSFPGGGYEPGDDSPVDTALRETHEEVGVPPEFVDVVGELDHLTTVSSDREIVPIVGLLAGRPAVTPDPAEVDHVLHVGLDELLDPAAYRSELWTWAGRTHPIHFFDVPGDTIWGATAAMLVEFLTLATGTGE